jgi:hypothetical protein
MTEPSLLAAAIQMKEPTARKFLRGAAGDAFAQAAASIIVDGLDDFMILRYAKDIGALQLVFMFRWADRAEEIMKRPYFEALLRACDHLEADERGRILISPGAMNFLQDGVEVAFLLQRGAATRADTMDDAEMTRFDQLLQETLYAPKIAQLAFADAIRKPKVFDAALRKKVEQSLKLHRQRVAIERLPRADALRPVRLCAKYHFNGSFMLYAAPGEVRPLIGLDPHSFRQQNWGGSDARHVVVDHRVLATDPENFKAIAIADEGVKIYMDAQRVYWPNLDPIDGADPKSFKCVSHGFARDAARWYYFKGQILPDVGANARLDATLYFFDFVLLMGDGAIYMGGRRLPLDTASTTLKRIEKYPPGPTAGLAMAWFEDRDGDLIVSAQTHSSSLTFERTDAPEARWDAIRAAPPEQQPTWRAADALRKALSADLNDAAEQRSFVGIFEPWIAENLESYRCERPLDPDFWRGVGDYFACCRSLGAPQKIMALYSDLAGGAWLNPRIFHSTAWAYASAGDPSAAVEEVRRALAYGCEGVDDLLIDEGLAPLFAREDFQALATWRRQNREQRRPFAPTTVLRTPQLCSAGLHMHYVDEVLRRFFIPNESALLTAYAGRPQEEAAFRTALATFVEAYAKALWRNGPHFSSFKDLYDRVGDVANLSASAHLIGAIALFAEGFFWIDLSGDDKTPRPEFAQAVAALSRMRAARASPSAQADADLWRKLAESPTTAPFIELAEKLAD